MCITFNSANLAKTKIYAGESKLDGKYVHVIAYQNKAITNGPNAMILPIPAAVMPTSENVIDTRRFARFLDDIHKANRIASKYESRSFSPGAQVFNVGSYTVVLAERSQAIAEAILCVPEKKRPAVSLAVLRAFDELYPGWPLAVCCWDGTINAEPLLWWYEPKAPGWLFAPALDAHDGEPPDLDADVLLDHHVAFGSTLDPIGNEVSYTDQIPRAARELLPARVRGTRLTGTMPNGDFWRAAGAYTGAALRCAPPGRATPKGFMAGLVERLRRSCPATPKAQVPLDGWHG